MSAIHVISASGQASLFTNAESVAVGVLRLLEVSAEALTPRAIAARLSAHGSELSAARVGYVLRALRDIGVVRRGTRARYFLASSFRIVAVTDGRAPAGAALRGRQPATMRRHSLWRSGWTPRGDKVDWTQPDADLARRLGYTKQHFSIIRKQLGIPQSPMKHLPAASRRLREWLRQNRGRVGSLTAEQIVAESGVERCSAAIANCMKAEGIEWTPPRRKRLPYIPKPHERWSLCNWALPSSDLAIIWGVTTPFACQRRKRANYGSALWSHRRLQTQKGTPEYEEYRRALEAERRKAESCRDMQPFLALQRWLRANRERAGELDAQQIRSESGVALTAQYIGACMTAEGMVWQARPATQSGRRRAPLTPWSSFNWALPNCDLSRIWHAAAGLVAQRRTAGQHGRPRWKARVAHSRADAPEFKEYRQAVEAEWRLAQTHRPTPSAGDARAIVFKPMGPARRVSNEAILASIRQFASKCGPTSPSSTKYRSWPQRACGEGTLRKRFGTWRKALQQAGLPACVCGHKYNPVQLMDNLEAIWRAMGRPPGKLLLSKHGARISTAPYVRRWGSVQKACSQLARFKRGEITAAELLGRSRASAGKAPSLSVRWDVMKRDNYTCVRCGRGGSDGLLDVVHVVPLARGGSNDPENLQTLCSDCSRGKNAPPDHTRRPTSRRSGADGRART